MICLETKDKILCFQIFFYRVSKFIWGMSLADRPMICKKLQFLVTNIILSIWIFKIHASEKTSSNLQSNLFGFKIQDSRLRKNFFNPTTWLRKNSFNPTSLDSRFKIQGSEKTSWILPPWVQEFSFGILNLESYLLGFKKFFLSLESWILCHWNQEVFSEPWTLNLESYVLGFEIFFVNLESWILNPTPLDSSFFLRVTSWIMNPSPLGFKDSLLESWILNPI